MERAVEIIRVNQRRDIRNTYDLEIFYTIAQLVKHTCHTYLRLSELELAIKEAHSQRFLDHEAASKALGRAVSLIQQHLRDRDRVYQELVSTWEKSRLPKGLSTEDKEFFHRQDRARHFAFRRADMSYLIYDEEKLGMEEYLKELKAYREYYDSLYLSGEPAPEIQP
jgi:hypothetical protein